jgi:serine/threonine protein phosphatase PrpC
MDYTLNTHPKGYALSCPETSLSICTFTSIPYAHRHWELSINDSKHSLTHRGIAIIESIPVLGAIAGTVEQLYASKHRTIEDPLPIELPPRIRDQPIVECQSDESSISEDEFLEGLMERFCDPLIPTWKRRRLPLEVAHQKMRTNIIKALQEHEAIEPSGPYISLRDLLIMESHTPTSPLALRCEIFETQGSRQTMEDTYINLEDENYALLAVLDGHGGKDAALYAKILIEKNFMPIFKKAAHIHQAFEELIDRTQEKVLEHEALDLQGTTLVISFLDKKNHHIYTATVGDSEANIYRKDSNEELKSIPLSCLRSWNHPKEERRITPLIERYPESSRLDKTPSDKYRYWHNKYSINLSRSIGDRKISCGQDEGPVITHKPKITSHRIKPGDILILACDGLKDFVTEKEIINLLNLSKKATSKKIGTFALKCKKSTDNITIILVRVS